MKKPLSIIALLLFITSSLIAQRGSIDKKKDSITRQSDSLTMLENKTFRHALILKINPGLIVTCPIVGELGGTLQYNISDTVAIFAGGGFNLANIPYTPDMEPTGYNAKPAEGYTIRTGVYIYLKRHHFISFQGFYRKWNTVTDLQGAYGDTFDYIWEPANAIFQGGGDPRFNSTYTVNKSSATSACIDILYGKQVLGKKNTHGFFEWYVGTGIRIKTYATQEVGTYDQNAQIFTPTSSPLATYKETDLDIKLGIQIGYKF